ncbi:MAG: hypothetical protein EXS69_02155, partial [Candidatus Zambryskibacteria bacterium]|nr:hypothetical protein [Candidatus Zambryskibacteria bacterium]
MLDIFKDGEEYISASRAAEKVGYSSDYIGQLCRAKKIPGQLVGRTWYIDLNSLVEHKKNKSRLSIYRTRGFSTHDKSGLGESDVAEEVSQKTTLAVREVREATSLTIIPETKSLHFLPFIPKKEKYIAPFITYKIVREIGVVTLSLVVAISVGFFTLEQSNPLVARVVRENLENVFPTLVSGILDSDSWNKGSGLLASVSLGEFIFDPLNSLFVGFSNLKDTALQRLFLAVTPAKSKSKILGTKLETPNESKVSYGADKSQQFPTTQVAVTGSTPALDLSSIKSDLRAELQSYIKTQLSSALEPRVIYISPTINAPVFRQEILMGDTRPTVTRQSDTDSSRLSSTIAHLTDGGTFTNSTLTSATVSGGTGGFTNFSFTTATGTSAT